jgi:xanthine dehydrogenase YagR molybdenum-binding subunit
MTPRCALFGGTIGRLCVDIAPRLDAAIIISVKTIRLQRPERDDPAGVKGLGELGNAGANATVANAVYHATGKRIRALPIRIEDFFV